MSEDEFWQIIESSVADPNVDRALQLDLLGLRLRKLDRKELIAFQTNFDARMSEAHAWPLWGSAYLINGGCSDDGFVYFCAWLISRGRNVYTLALEDPDTLAKIVDPERDDYEFEELWSVAREVYEEKFDDEMPQTTATWPDSPRGERWDFDDDEASAIRLPRLAGLYLQ
jgi:hypothetical protein